MKQKISEFGAVVLSNNEYHDLKRAARRKDRVIQSADTTLDPSSGLCYWSDLAPDGQGGSKLTDSSQLLLSDEGVRYIKLVKRQRTAKAIKEIKEWAAIVIALAALIVAIVK